MKRLFPFSVEYLENVVFAEVLRLVRNGRSEMSYKKSSMDGNGVRAVSKRFRVHHDSTVETLLLVGLSVRAPLPFPSDWSRFAALRKIRILNSKDLLDLSPLSSCSTLTSLELNSCGNITGTDVQNLAPLSTCRAITKLIVDFCCKVTDISVVAHLAALEFLSVVRCRLVRDFSAIASCHALVRLYMLDVLIDDVSPIARCSALEFLNIESCSNIVDVSPLARCQSLRCLSLHHELQTDCFASSVKIDR